MKEVTLGGEKSVKNLFKMFEAREKKSLWMGLSLFPAQRKATSTHVLDTQADSTLLYWYMHAACVNGLGC